MARTYEGITGRAIGFVGASVFSGVGIWVFTIGLVGAKMVPETLQRVVVSVSPWLSTAAGREPSTEGPLIGLLAGGLFLTVGVYHLAKVFLVDDYSITVGASRND